MNPRLAWIPPVLARLMVGPLFVATGWSKLHDLEKVTQYFSSGLGLPFPDLMARVVGTGELVCGALLLLGLFTRLATVPLITFMLFAVFKAKWGDIDGLASLGEISEALYLPILAYLGVYGGGLLSMDTGREEWTRSRRQQAIESSGWIPSLPLT